MSHYFLDIQYINGWRLLECMINPKQFVQAVLFICYIDNTVCPRSFGPFYIVSYYLKKSRLLGHTVDENRARHPDFQTLFFFYWLYFQPSQYGHYLGLCVTQYKSTLTRQTGLKGKQILLSCRTPAGQIGALVLRDSSCLHV